MRMLRLAVAALAVTLPACQGGSLGLRLGDGDGGVTLGPAGGDVVVTGSFEAAGKYGGVYTLTTTPGPNVDSCSLRVDDGPEGTSAQVDTDSGDGNFDLTLKVHLSATATFSVKCTVTATSNDDPSRVIYASAPIVVTQ